MIKNTLSRYEFSDAFTSGQYKDNFTYQGLNVLYDYFEDLSDDIGEDIDLDVVAICCDFSEYESMEEYFKDFHSKEEVKEMQEEAQELCIEEDKESEAYKDELQEELSNILLEKIRNNTILIKLGDNLNEGFIVQAY